MKIQQTESVLKSKLLGAAVLSLFFCADMGLAQEVDLASAAADDTSTDTDDARKLDTVIVTGRKREERFIDVPVVSSVLDGEQLENSQTTDFFNAADRIPGLVVGDNVGSTGANVTLRGIGTASFNSSSEGAVSVNIDGLQFSHGDVLRSGFFDVEQVEVLKGPQALFFGKNSPGGIISLQTADPTDDFELIARGGYEFEAREAVGEFIVSGPVSETFGARLALAYSDQEGFFKNVAQPTPGLGGAGPKFDRISNSERLFGRLTLKFEPTDRFDARLKINFEDVDTQGDGGSAQFVGCDNPDFDPFENCILDDEIAIADLDPALFGPFSAAGFTYDGVTNGGVQFQEASRAFGTLEMNYDLTDALKLTSVTGYAESDNSFMVNGSFQPGAVDQTSAILLPPASVTIVAPSESEQRYVTQEVRLTSDFANSPVNFMVGGYYEDGFQSFTNNSNIPLALAYLRKVDELDIRTLSAFGQLIWDVSDTLEIAGGLRWTDEKRNAAQMDDGVVFDPGSLTFIRGPGEVALPVTELKADNVSPELTVTWKPQENLTIFGAYKEGFKSGSFNVEQANTAVDSSYDPETAQGFELGLKSILFDNSLRFNAAIYSYEYDDLQVSKVVTLSGIGALTSLQIVNAAAATVQGAEFDFAYTPPEVDGLNIFGAVAYNDGKFDDFEGAACYGGQTVALGCDQNFSTGANSGLLPGFTGQSLSGRTMPRSPKWSGNIGFDYDRPITSDGLMLGISSSANYTDETFRDVTYNPRTLQKSFTKTNASLRLYAEDQSWELALIGNNLTNEITASTCASTGLERFTGLVPNFSGVDAAFTGGLSDNALCFAQPGREAWVRFTVRR